LVVFAFVPVVAALPGWMLSEARNALNWQDPVVLAFVPVRGVMALLDAFADGVVPGGMAGTFAGLLLTGWSLTGRRTDPRLQRIVVGAAAGMLAAAMVVTIVAAHMMLAGHALALPALPTAFELGSGATCGAIAAPTALGYFAASAGAPAGKTS
jgi:hypothetical protein